MDYLIFVWVAAPGLVLDTAAAVSLDARIQNTINATSQKRYIKPSGGWQELYSWPKRNPQIFSYLQTQAAQWSKTDFHTDWIGAALKSSWNNYSPNSKNIMNPFQPVMFPVSMNFLVLVWSNIDYSSGYVLLKWIESHIHTYSLQHICPPPPIRLITKLEIYA